MKPDETFYIDTSNIPGYKEWFDATIDDWCDDHDGLEAYYHTDNEKPTQICPDKHHYHCEQCNLLTQIG